MLPPTRLSPVEAGEKSFLSCPKAVSANLQTAKVFGFFFSFLTLSYKPASWSSCSSSTCRHFFFLAQSAHLLAAVGRTICQSSIDESRSNSNGGILYDTKKYRPHIFLERDLICFVINDIKFLSFKDIRFLNIIIC